MTTRPVPRSTAITDQVANAEFRRANKNVRRRSTLRMSPLSDPPQPAKPMAPIVPYAPYSKSSRFARSSAFTTSPTCCARSRDGDQQRIGRVHHNQILYAQQRHQFAAGVDVIVAAHRGKSNPARRRCRSRRAPAIRKQRPNCRHRSSRNSSQATPMHRFALSRAPRNRSRCFRTAGKACFSFAAKLRERKAGKADRIVAVFGRCWRNCSSSASRPPEEHAGVPVEIARLQRTFRLAPVRLLAELQHRTRLQRPAFRIRAETRYSRSRFRASAARCPAPAILPCVRRS